MNDRLKKARIKDIAVTKLICYNPLHEDNLRQFCFRNGISYLPDVDRKFIYQLSEDGFTKRSLTEDYCLNPEELLFDITTVRKFERVDENEIKFVVEDGKIVGVVHIVDYNNEFIAVELYRSFFRFENALRSLLIKNGLCNQDLINWVKINRDYEMFMSDGSNYWTDKYERMMPSDPYKYAKVENQRQLVYPFQTFYFKELLEFAVDQNLLNKNIFNTYSLYHLRNFMAHSRHFVSVAESDEGQLLYDFNNLKDFVSNINRFFLASDELERLLAENVKTSDSVIIL